MCAQFNSGGRHFYLQGISEFAGKSGLGEISRISTYFPSLFIILQLSILPFSLSVVLNPNRFFLAFLIFRQYFESHRESEFSGYTGLLEA